MILEEINLVLIMKSQVMKKKKKKRKNVKKTVKKLFSFPKVFIT